MKIIAISLRKYQSFIKALSDDNGTSKVTKQIKTSKPVINFWLMCSIQMLCQKQVLKYGRQLETEDAKA